MNNFPDPAAHRQRYSRTSLESGDLTDTPLAQLRSWYAEAVAGGEREPNAMALGTVDADNHPYTRMVLLKDITAQGLSFFTNTHSRKGQQLAANPWAAATLWWPHQQRQVGVHGPVTEIEPHLVSAYFGSRPWESRIGAWASNQSDLIDNPSELHQRWREAAALYPDTGATNSVPVPPHWGGYVIQPVEVEFWNGQPSRLHDRLVFAPNNQPDDVSGTSYLPRLDDAAAWHVVRRQP